MSFSRPAFSQDLVEDEGRKVEAPLDPANSYWVLCSGVFSDGWSVSDSAPAEATPPC